MGVNAHPHPCKHALFGFQASVISGQKINLTDIFAIQGRETGKGGLPVWPLHHDLRSKHFRDGSAGRSISGHGETSWREGEGEIGEESRLYDTAMCDVETLAVSSMRKCSPSSSLLCF